MKILQQMNLQDKAFSEYAQIRRELWDSLSIRSDLCVTPGRKYRSLLSGVFSRLVSPGSKVLEIGCAEGDLLFSLRPANGLGVDFSEAMVEVARKKYPHLRFQCMDAHTLKINETFDYVVLSDLVNDVWDVQELLENVRQVCTPNTRIILNFYSHIWKGPLTLFRKLKLARPQLQQNWLTRSDVAGLLDLAGFEVIRQWPELICPFPIPLLAPLCNRWLARIFPFRHLSITNFAIARPKPVLQTTGNKPTVSVIVPARNESGNIPDMIDRIPEMGAGTEIVFVEGNSSDDTYTAIEKAIAARPGRNCKLFKQAGRGKGDAVRLGFDKASGDILMILDADLTVPPEALPRFYHAIADGTGEFINGIRLVYPMEEKAMRFFNLVGNKFFSMAFSYMLEQPIKDTLCGTKVITRINYERVAAGRAYFGNFDPFGDFDLLFGAARLNLKIIGLPVRYRERIYGETNIQRWHHGFLLLRMVLFAARRIKFV